MRKSIELGRAVLSTSTANLELWLRTLIFISPQQQDTNLGQRDAASILSLLSSGEVWVGRGNGLYIDLDLTLSGQPLADEQLQHLSEAILEAPAWEQLNLKPTLPYDAVHESGKLRILVDHSNRTTTLAARQSHRALSNILATDVRPPEGVSSFSLDSVVLYMDMFQLQPPKKTVSPAKRMKTSGTGNNLSQSMECRNLDDVDHQPADMPHLDPKPVCRSPLTSPRLKRPRALDSPADRITTSPVLLPNEDLLGSRLGSEACETHKKPFSPTEVKSTSMHTLIDGALRLSVLSSINGKASPGIKVKANTFGPGLSDLAPTLWRPGYIVSVSQRANLLPTIGRSLCQYEATTRTTSITLKHKLLALTAQLPPLRAPVYVQSRGPSGVSEQGCSPSSIATHLWLHLQKHTPCKTATSLQSFVTTVIQSTPFLEDMLEEPWHALRKTCRAMPSSHESPSSGGASYIDQHLEGCPADTVACGEPSSGPHFLGVVAIPNSSLKVDGDELLLGDERFEDANLSAFCGGEVQ